MNVKILYVGGMPGPLKDILSGKKESEITHAPQFFHVWHKLVKRGHEVDFVVTSNFNGPYDIKVGWFSQENLYANIYDPVSEAPWYRRIFRRIKRFSKLFYAVYTATKEKDYDFIYCITYQEGIAGNIVANLKGIPCGMRSMGTMLNEDFKRYGVWGTALRRPAEFLMFKMNKVFFVMTDDGTKGDIVYQLWRPTPPKYDFYFWKTGIDMKTIDQLNPTLPIPKHPYIFFAARFDGWKRHDKVLKIVHLLHQRGEKIHLYFAGNITYNSRFEEIKALVHEYHLDSFVHFMGAISQDDVKNYAYHAVANPLMYDISNLGNVFFELLSVGAVVLGKNDGTLDAYLKHEKNGFVINSEEEAVEIIEILLKMNDIVNNIKKNAVFFARKNFLSIDERFDKEVYLIERAVQ